MASQASIRVIKQFTYRGVLRNFSNRYHFTNGAPTDNAHWTTFSDAVTTAEKAIFAALASGGSKIIETVGYDAGSEVPVFSKTYSLDGTGVFTSLIPATGDTAALVRYSTAARSTKNHPIYCFNYYHSAMFAAGAGNQDTLGTAMKTALQTYASSWITGFSDGTTNHVRCTPQGELATGSLVEPLLTHRDLPR